MRKLIKTYLIITIGTLLMAFGVYFFEFTNNFSTGGVSGIAIVLSRYLGFITPAQLVIIFNVFLLIIGFMVFGKSFGAKTVYSSVLMSVVLTLLEAFYPMSGPFTDQIMLELFFDMILVSLGAALIFNEEGSSGGTDIIAMILKKYTGLNIGKSLLLVDFLVICAALAVFGIEIGMFSLFAIVIRALVVDNAIEGFNASKFFLVVTDKEQEVLSFIMNDLERGATIVNNCEGAYTKYEKRIIITVVDRRQAVRLKHKINEIDKTAFTIIGTSSEIIGDGFKLE